jgi:hypothetical protein
MGFDCSEVKDDEALEAAASLGDCLRDLTEVWSDMYMSQRLESAREVVALCSKIASRGLPLPYGPSPAAAPPERPITARYRSGPRDDPAEA